MLFVLAATLIKTVSIHHNQAVEKKKNATIYSDGKERKVIFFA